jgi:hypothetical protein
MIDNRTQNQIRHRLEWAQDDLKALKEKSLNLMAKLGPLDEGQRAQWEECTLHLANIESHVHNALQRVPETKIPEEQ